MNEYISDSVYSLIAVALITALISVAVGKGPLQASLKTVCSLAILSVLFNVLLPVFTLIGDIAYTVPDSDEIVFDGSNDEAYICETGRYICVYTEDMLSEKFSIDKNEFSVGATLEADEDNNVKIKTVTVTFSSEPKIEASLISDYVSETLMCECIVLFTEAN